MFGSDLRTSLRGESTFGEQAIDPRLIGLVRSSTLPGWVLGILLIATAVVWRVASDEGFTQKSAVMAPVGSGEVESNDLA